MKLATLRGPSRDGSLLVVDRALRRALNAGVAASMQQALERWDEVAPSLAEVARDVEKATSSDAYDFQRMVADGRIAAPLPRAYEWLDGSAYLTHVERVRRARNDKVPESFYTDPLMYQGGAGDMMGPRDPIRVMTEEWGVDLEGEVVAIVGDVRMGATPAQAAKAVRLLTLVNDVSFRRLIPAELAKGFGFVNGKGANALAPVAVTPDELGDAWKDGRVHLDLHCRVNGQLLGRPNAGRDATFGLFELIAHAAKTRELAAGTMIGTGTISNQDPAAGYACLMEKRLVEQVESGEAKTPFLRFGDRVQIQMSDANDQLVFGTIDQVVERYA
jgi:fumarylacetoacetate (FAA) hydrolase